MATRGFTRHIPLALLICAVAVVVGLHALRPDVNPGLDYVSQYGSEDWSWMFGLALVFCAIGLLSLGSALREARDSRGGPKLMRASAALLGLAALFPSDRRGEVASASLGGFIHGTAAIAGLSLLTVAVAMISLTGKGTNKSSDGPRRLGGGVLPFALGAIVVCVVSIVLFPEANGLRQRMLLVVVFGWLLLIARKAGSLQQPDLRARRDCEAEGCA